MTCRRLAMLGVVNDHETPRTLVTGREYGVRVKCVGAEDVVEMVVLDRLGETRAIRLVEGETPLSLLDHVAYRIRKIAGKVPHATTVEILLNG